MAPLPCGDGVTFFAFEDTAEARRGAYFISPLGIQVIVDESTPVPGATGMFEDVKEMTCVGSTFVFLGSETPAPNRRWSVYRKYLEDGIEIVQEKDAAIDGLEIESFLEVSANTLGVGMRGRTTSTDPNEAMVAKTYKGDLSLVADSSMVLPGQTEPVVIFSLPFVVGTDLLFRARTSSEIGLFRWSEGQGISVAADHQTPVPSGSGTFSSFGLMALLSEGVAFEALSNQGFGIYIIDDGQIEPLVVPGDVTETGETITAAYEPSGTGSLLGFTATTVENPLPAVFARTHDVRLHRILGTGDVIEGAQIRLVNARAIGPHVAIRVDALQAELVNVIYRATFEQGIVDIPALSLGGLLALAALIAASAALVLKRRPVKGFPTSETGR